jgi:hypothetical protein
MYVRIAAVGLFRDQSGLPETGKGAIISVKSRLPVRFDIARLISMRTRRLLRQSGAFLPKNVEPGRVRLEATWQK